MNGENGKASEEEEEEDDDDDDTDEEEEMNNIRLDESLNKVFAGELDLENENNSDLDDETMMKMDKTIAMAFKMRQKERKVDNSKIEYKLKALDLIQELFKTAYRLDLVHVIV